MAFPVAVAAGTKHVELNVPYISQADAGNFVWVLDKTVTDPLTLVQLEDQTDAVNVGSISPKVLDDLLHASRHLLGSWEADRDYILGPPETDFAIRQGSVYIAVAPSGPSNGGGVDPLTDVTNTRWKKLTEEVKFGKFISDWDVAANAAMPTPVDAAGDWYVVTGVTVPEADAGGKAYNGFVVKNGDIFFAKDTVGAWAKVSREDLPAEGTALELTTGTETAVRLWAPKTLEDQYGKSEWQYSTDGMTATHGDHIIVQPNHNINVDSALDLQEITWAPVTGNWQDIFAGTGSFVPTDVGWTFGNGQTMPFGSDIMRSVSSLGTTNWLLFSGGEDVPSQSERFETVALLPLPATVNSGAVAVVYNDPTAAFNRPYVAIGPANAAATGWQ